MAMPISSIVRQTSAAPKRRASSATRLGLLLAGFEVDRVDDRAPAVELQRLLDHVDLRGVDHQRQAALRGPRARPGWTCPSLRRGPRRRSSGPARARRPRPARSGWRTRRRSRRPAARRGTSSSRSRSRARRRRAAAVPASGPSARTRSRPVRAASIVRAGRGEAVERLPERADMVRRGAAAAADDVQADFARQFAQRGGERVAARADNATWPPSGRQPRVRHAGDEPGPVLRRGSRGGCASPPGRSRSSGRGYRSGRAPARRPPRRCTSRSAACRSARP